MNYRKLIVIYVVIVFILQVVPTGLPGGGGLNLSGREFFLLRLDRLLHLLLFLPWMILIWLYLRQKGVRGNRRTQEALGWLLAGLILAAAAEGLQYWVPYRTLNPLDLAGNLTGVLLGALAFAWPGRGRRAGRT